MISIPVYRYAYHCSVSALRTTDHWPMNNVIKWPISGHLIGHEAIKPCVRQHLALSILSADVPSCLVPRTLSSYGDRTFAAAGPRLWNSLAVQLRNPDITYGLFRRQLKGHFFRKAWTRRSVTSDMRRLRKKHLGPT